jgi:uncharacterized protein (DUF362 family)
VYGDNKVTGTPRPATVAITRCPDYEPKRLAAALRENLAFLGGIERFVKRGERVMIKPNFIAPLPREVAGQTDPEIIVQLAILLQDMGARPFVADSPAWGSIGDCAGALGLTEPLKRLGVELRQLNKPRKVRIQPSGDVVGISGIAMDADKLINLPKLKAHRQVGATIAVKNMFGCVSGKAKAFWHFRRGGDERRFCELLLGIYGAVPPVLNIIDGVVAMEGAGPMNGRPRNLGLIVTSQDPLACEMVCAEIIGVAEKDLPILRTARQIGLVNYGLADIDVVGQSVQDCICRDFLHVDRIPIKFKFLRVCKSIAKQLVRFGLGGVRDSGGNAGVEAGH